MKRKYSINVHPRWDVTFSATEDQIAFMRADGLVIDEIVNIVPDWLPAFLVKPWIKIQDGWQWLRLF